MNTIIKATISGSTNSTQIEFKLEQTKDWYQSNCKGPNTNQNIDWIDKNNPNKIYCVVDEDDNKSIGLHQAYLATSYEADCDGKKIIIKIGEENKSLHQILVEREKNTWAFITAANPYSMKQFDIKINASLNQDLKNALQQYICFDAEGVPDQSNRKPDEPEWLPEPSFLVLGISKIQATFLGSQFEQNAIVYGTTKTSAELIFCPQTQNFA